MSSSKSCASVGGNYTRKLYFDPRADQSSTGGYWITNEELRQKLSNLIDTEEQIKNASVYSNPLTKKQRRKGKLYHAFVVIETNEWWWSIEKNTKCITIQRSKNLVSVRDMYQRKKRTTGRNTSTLIREIKTTQGRNTTINELINYMWRKDVLNNDYHVLSANCQEFAALLFDRIESFEEQVYFDEVADESPSRSTSFYMTVDKAFEEVKRCGGSKPFTKQETYKLKVPFLRHLDNYRLFESPYEILFARSLMRLSAGTLAVLDYWCNGGKYDIVMIFETKEGTFWSLEQLNTTVVIHRAKNKDVLLNLCQRHPRRTSLKSSKMVEGLHWKNMNEAMEYFCKNQKYKIDQIIDLIFLSLGARRNINFISSLYNKSKRTPRSEIVHV
ncbi:hypothetical protein GHT06_014586 [Daphnia sinensis]|uniref:PPPDE domain-containing protein n=1 Tax=Daphnia sinensis TaxID=1820382 RepID=A0AAD5PSI6_9CRUS|nr:hypothetical protein GHT06_014586 [Daphnia sinensis]